MWYLIVSILDLRLLTYFAELQSGRVHIVKMLITLEPHGIFGPNYEYLYILTLSRHC